jgi:hypothetical protein
MGVQTVMSQFVVCLAKYVHKIIFLPESFQPNHCYSKQWEAVVLGYVFVVYTLASSL